MTEYITNIKKLASEKSPEIFYNSCDSHALIVLKNLVKNATQYIKAICGNMCSEVSNDKEYLNFIEDFLLKDIKHEFKILFDDYNDTFLSKPIAKILAKFPNQVEIRKLRSGNITYENKPIHLTVSDDRAFRLETDIQQKMAWGCFNDEKKAKVFSSAFDLFFTDKYSERIFLPNNLRTC